MAHRHRQAQHLLHLELHSVKDALHLLSRILAVGDHRGELSSSVQTRSYQSGKLLDQSIGSEEGVVLLAKLTNHLLVLVDGGDLINVHARNILLLAQLLVLIVHEHAHVDLGASGVGELERTSETLVLSRINLLQSDLKLHVSTKPLFFPLRVSPSISMVFPAEKSRMLSRALLRVSLLTLLA